MTTQPEALRLAEELDDGYPLTGDAISAAAELRTQHARITELEAQLSAIGAGGVSPLRNAAQETEATHLRELAAPSTDQVEEILRERDDADDFIDALLDEVLGPERPEWSSAYGRADALNDVRERMTALHKPAVDKAWDRFQSAMEAPQQPAPSPVPAGWKLVPVEPTEEMLKAADDGDDAYTLRCFGPGVQRVMQGPYDHYCAMLDAAPTAQADTQPAQQGVAYAALPTSNYAGRVYEEGFLIGTCPLYTADQMRAFADATYALRASHGQAPAPTHEQIAAYLESTGAYVTNDATREAAIAEAIDTDRAKRGQALRLLTQKEKDSLGRRAEGMDGNEWDQWVQEKFAQVNGLKVQGGSYEWDWE